VVSALLILNVGHGTDYMTGQSPTEQALFWTAMVLMAAHLLQKVLGLPEWLANVCLLAGILSLGLIFYLKRRDRSRSGGAKAMVATGRARPGPLWLLITVLALISASWPFAAPYTGINAPLSTLVTSSIIAFIIGVVITVVVSRRCQ